MLNIKIFRFNPLQENTVLLWDDSLEGAIVDPGCSNGAEFDTLTQYIDAQGVKPKIILLTHGHFDHVAGAAQLAHKYGIPACMGEEDKSVLEGNAAAAENFGFSIADFDFTTIPVREGEVLRFGQTEFEVIETPGHTPGGRCYLDKKDKLLISGDTLFAGSIGRTDLPGGDYDKLIVSIMDRLMGFDGDTDVIPGHGAPTSIGRERTWNPFLQPFNEPEEDITLEP